VTVISHLNTKQALANPEAEFDGPEQLLDEVGLTAGQKLATLARWAQSIESRLDASAEGMPPSGRENDDAELLRRIRKAQESLVRADG